ncbi:creatininase family protein [Kordiimonas pumila]|uniref:Creatininase family protein n=1 Tax=Kordiimonas pumila TaxID=2161677 RepID=A0ABV7D542_9PROT|nr:creatininase family protein [Kordiimonas pumila]
MRFSEMNWSHMADYLARDDRCVLPLGCVEQHAALSLCVDAIVSERMAVEAAEPLGIPVCPVLSYSATPSHAAFPGTISVRLSTFLNMVEDILTSLLQGGFRRILIVNGHGGNTPAKILAQEILAKHPSSSIIFHSWWTGPETAAAIRKIGPDGTHANWLENLPWTRLDAEARPPKAPINEGHMDASPPEHAKKMLGDGSYGGRYVAPEEDMLEMWRVAVAETRDLLENSWPSIN